MRKFVQKKAWWLDAKVRIVLISLLVVTIAGVALFEPTMPIEQKALQVAAIYLLTAYEYLDFRIKCTRWERTHQIVQSIRERKPTPAMTVDPRDYDEMRGEVSTGLAGIDTQWWERWRSRGKLLFVLSYRYTLFSLFFVLLGLVAYIQSHDARLLQIAVLSLVIALLWALSLWNSFEKAHHHAMNAHEHKAETQIPGWLNRILSYDVTYHGKWTFFSYVKMMVILSPFFAFLAFLTWLRWHLWRAG